MSKKMKKARGGMAESNSSAFVAAVGKCKPVQLATYCKSDLSALDGEHRKLLSFGNTRDITGSLNYDKGMTASGDKAEKWDYAVGYRASTKETCVWVEVHPASTGEVKKMLGKLAALKAWLQSDGKGLSELTYRHNKPFVWVSTDASVSFTANSEYGRKLAMAGMGMPQRNLRLPLS